MSQFYKVTPKRMDLGEKVKFLWVENESEEAISFLAFSLGDKFFDGCNLSPADKADESFIRYVNSDLVQVQKDMEKLELLKQRLLIALAD